MQNEEKKLRQFLLKGSAALLGGVFLYAAGKFLLPILLPFLFAFVLAAILKKPRDFLHRRLHLPTALTCWILTLALLALTALLLSFFIGILISHCKELLIRFSEDPTIFSSTARFLAEKMENRFPSVKENRFWAILQPFWDAFAKALPEKISTFLGRFLSSFSEILPQSLLFLCVLVFSTVYLLRNYETTTEFLLRKTPPWLQKRIPFLKRSLRISGVITVKTAGLLFFGNFFLLLFGFSVLGIQDPLFPAIATAFLDLLPIFGTGTVLIPWGLFSLLTGNFYRGVGLLILYLFSLLARQILLPHLIHSETKVSPILSLLLLYLSYRLFGGIGILLTPFLTALLPYFLPKKT